MLNTNKTLTNTNITSFKGFFRKFTKLSSKTPSEIQEFAKSHNKMLIGQSTVFNKQSQKDELVYITMHKEPDENIHIIELINKNLTLIGKNSFKLEKAKNYAYICTDVFNKLTIKGCSMFNNKQHLYSGVGTLLHDTKITISKAIGLKGKFITDSVPLAMLFHKKYGLTNTKEKFFYAGKKLIRTVLKKDILFKDANLENLKQEVKTKKK